MRRQFTTYVALITCDWADCETIIREVDDSQHMANVAASIVADYDGWTAVGHGHRCPEHRPVSLAKEYVGGTYRER